MKTSTTTMGYRPETVIRKVNKTAWGLMAKPKGSCEQRMLDHL